MDMKISYKHGSDTVALTDYALGVLLNLLIILQYFFIAMGNRYPFIYLPFIRHDRRLYPDGSYRPLWPALPGPGKESSLI